MIQVTSDLFRGWRKLIKSGIKLSKPRVILNKCEYSIENCSI